ncbi:hypothetical protein FKM82_029931, partial [Ascaphus truei]
HITPEKFYVEACDDGAEDVLAVDRVSTEVTLTVKKNVPPSAVTRPIYGILGTIRLVAGVLASGDDQAVSFRVGLTEKLLSDCVHVAGFQIYWRPQKCYRDSG